MLILQTPGAQLVFFSLEKGTDGRGRAQNFKRSPQGQKWPSPPTNLPWHQTWFDLAEVIPWSTSESPQGCCQSVPTKLSLIVTPAKGCPLILRLWLHLSLGHIYNPPHWSPCFHPRPYLHSDLVILNKNHKASLVL